MSGALKPGDQCVITNPELLEPYHAHLAGRFVVLLRIYEGCGSPEHDGCWKKLCPHWFVTNAPTTAVFSHVVLRKLPPPPEQADQDDQVFYNPFKETIDV